MTATVTPIRPLAATRAIQAATLQLGLAVHVFHEDGWIVAEFATEFDAGRAARAWGGFVRDGEVWRDGEARHVFRAKGAKR